MEYRPAPSFLPGVGTTPRSGGRSLYWENIVALAVAHAGAVAGLVYAFSGRASPWTFALAGLWLALCMMSTTAGYHRLFAHRSYRAADVLRAFYLAFGAAAGQGSALSWASDHRAHHAMTDRDGDPYDITRGFWWAHIGWMLYRNPPSDGSRVRDLALDPLVRVQDRCYLPLAVAFGFALPAGLAALWGDWLGGLLLAGFLRLVVEYHATFSINSVAHTFGKRPYTKDVSARDSTLAALLTFGEGYHNYHHRFPGDYRNGVRPYHVDPTKWWIWLASKTGLARDLRRSSPEAIADARRKAARRG